MTGKERISKMWNGENVDRCGFWLGCPTEESMRMYYRYFQVNDRLELAKLLEEDVYWLPMDFGWECRNGIPAFDVMGGRAYTSDSSERRFTGCTDPAEVYNTPWPDATTLNFDHIDAELTKIERTGMAVFGGMWSCFFHIVADFFSMEEYFVKMYTDPEVVEAVTEKVGEFYLTTNRLIFKKFAHRIDACFMGNDFGTQLCLLLSPDQLRKFVIPTYKKLIDLAHSFGLKVIVHSCGAIARIIPDLIEVGIDGLHPLQAKAAEMDAESLKHICGDKLLLMGGIDTQELLPFGTPGQVRAEVRRVAKLLAPKFVISPSHEAILPNVPCENVSAMAELELRYL